MKKKQTKRLSVQHETSKGVIGIFGQSAQKHDGSVNELSKLVLITLQDEFPELEFRYRAGLKKAEINKKLNEVDHRLGKTIFLDKSRIKPDGGVIEVKDKDGKWRIVLVSEAKHQGKDIDNISEGVLVGTKKNQDIMVAGNAIERSHKNINEIRNIMIDEKHFPYLLFLQGSNFLTEKIKIKTPEGREVELDPTNGALNRIDRLTAANYGLPINENCCENIFILVNDNLVMLQAVSIYAKGVPWTMNEMHEIAIEVTKTSLRVLGMLNAS